MHDPLNTIDRTRSDAATYRDHCNDTVDDITENDDHQAIYRTVLAAEAEACEYVIEQLEQARAIYLELAEKHQHFLDTVNAPDTDAYVDDLERLITTLQRAARINQHIDGTTNELNDLTEDIKAHYTGRE